MVEPVAYAIYGRKTGRMCRVVMVDELDDDEMAAYELFYDVKPLYLREQEDNEHIG